MSTRLTLLLLIAVLSATSAVQKRYDGYKVLRVNAQNERHAKILDRLNHFSGVDFWTDVRRNGPTDIMVSPEISEKVVGFLRKRGISFTVHLDNVQTLIDAEHGTKAASASPSPKLLFTQYNDLQDIQSWMDDLAVQYPNITSILSIGKSFEGRDQKVIKISSGGSGKPAILIDGGMHGREWITTATVTFIISKLVENYEENAFLVDNVDWYIMPNVNPDGYEYTRTEDRMWRKTRSNGTNPLDCVGVDPNRNFDFHWGEIGSTNLSCSEAYHGPTPFSEVESQNLANFLNANNFSAYLSFHCYGQFILTPYGYTSEPPEDFDDLYSLATNATAALEAVYGTKYTVGTSSTVYYPNSGASEDYAKGAAGEKYSYTYELPDDGTYGFFLPTERIIPVGVETFESIRAFGTFFATT